MAELASNRACCEAAWRVSDLGVTARRRTAITLWLAWWGCGWRGGMWLARSSHGFALCVATCGERVAPSDGVRYCLGKGRC
eukprot:364985-Chlamydomonas_euryale.AAC.2